jgi:predicted RNA binding protein YcfA (HicA-like mRNA interferase family)
MIVKVLSLQPQKTPVKAYKVKEIIAMLEADGWYLHAIRGDHRHFKHKDKLGKVTVPNKLSTTLEQYILNSIFKQAGWR